jgi:DNA-binding transcriptional LysR family regulator
MNDRYVNLDAEGVDLVVRLAEPKDTDLLARRLGSARIVVCGSPSYLGAHGRPERPEDLVRHRCLAYLARGHARPWRLSGEDGERHFGVSGPLHCDKGESLRDAAVAGLGLVQLFEFIVADELVRGALVTVLDDVAPPPRPIYAMVAPRLARTPKLRVVIEFLTELFQSGRLAGLTTTRPRPPAPPPGA